MNKIIKIIALVVIIASSSVAQTLPNDCVRAVTVCGNGTFFSNASGIGTTQEISACSSFEHYSLWLKITIAPWVVAGSTLGFNLIPDDPSLTVDYDFWVYGPNTACGALGSAIRCCTTNPGPAPGGANLTSNVTGMVGTSLTTTSGPGSNGNGFVRWLTVSPGQTYYIAIDRPSGNGGFQIQWTGTAATTGPGAFPTPPSTNPVPDQKTCSNTPNVGIFNLNTIRPIINSDLINNTISFHTTISNAIDNISPLPNIYVNTSNPQTIYARVTDISTGCFSTTSFNLIVNLVPSATLNVSNSVICNGNSVTVTYAGTPGASFDYTIDGGPFLTSIFPPSGLFILNETLNSTRTYTLNEVRNLDTSGNVICNQPLNVTRTVTVNQQPDAGINGGITICASSLTPIDLFSLITGEQTGGTWTRNTGTGGIFNAAAGTFTPAAGATTSTFTYTLTGVAPCTNDISVATINIGGQPDAGIDGTTIICDNSTTTIDLFSLITGEQSGGTWTRNTGTGGTFNATAGTFTPIAGATTSTFTYTLTGVAPCVTDTSLATITINPQPTAGTDGSTTICDNSNTTIDLFSLITGEQTGGTWTRNTGTGGIFNAAAGTFTPAAGATTSTFTYTLTGVAPCVNDSSVATINIGGQPDAGIDGTTIICDNSTTTIDLFSLITGEQSGGTWTRNTGTGGTFNATAGTFTPIAGATTSTFTYTLTGVAPCVTDTSLATITINPQPTAGTDGSTTICDNSNTTIDLFSLITGEQTGGTWTRNTGTGGIFNAAAGTFTPAAGATTSTFTYTLTGVAPCVNDSSVATINIGGQPTAGTDGATTICDNSTTTIDLFSLISGEQTGGTWTQTTGTVGTFNATAGTFTPTAGATTSTFTYTLTGIAPCTNDSSVATITINPQPDAGTDGATTICDNSTTTIDLFSLITGEQMGGTWTQTTGTGGTFNATAGTFTPIAGATTSTFTYTLTGIAPCTNDSSVATITINPQPTAGTDGATTICESSTTTIDLFSLITGEQSGGIWTRTTGTAGTFNATAGTFTPAVGATTSTFTYTVTGVAPCVNDTSLATITINTLPIITQPSNYVVCDDSNNNDGIYCAFDLNTKINEITAGNPNIVVSFYETDTSTSAIPLNVNYCNIQPGLQTIYVTAHTLGSPSCFITTSFNLIINPLPLANPVISNYELCDYNAPGDGQEQFTLNTKTAEIANGQTNVAVSYYATQPEATSQTNPLPNLYSNTSNPQEIWINIRNTTTGCNTVSSFNLVVNPLPVATVPEPLFECSNGASNQAMFNLTLNEAVVTGGVSGLTVSYYNTLLNAQNETSAIQTPQNYLGTDNELLYIRIENNATGCYATTTQLLRVTQGPIAITPQPLQYCDPNNDGFGSFDLNAATTEIAGGTWPLTGVSIGYYETETDALLGANPSLTSPYTNITPGTQTIYVRVFYTLTGCANYVQLQLQVNPTPEATTPSDYVLCDTTGSAGQETFDLTTTIPEILGTINPALTTVTFYTTFQEAQSGNNAISTVTNYLNTTLWNQTIYVRVTTIATGCYDIVELHLQVNPLPNSLQPNYPQYSLCDLDQTNIGFEIFDLADKIDDILLGQTGMSVTFYPSLGDAQNNTSAITNLDYQNQIIYVQTLGIRITNMTTGCYVISTMDIRVEPLPSPIPPTEPYVVCDDNQDGISCDIDLTTLETEILQSANYTLSFYETQINAQTGSNPINTAVPYCNIDPFSQLLYVRAVDPITGCWSVIPITITVEPSPITPFDLDDITVCDQDNNPQNAITTIDLTQRTQDVLALQPTTGSYIVTYYTSQLAAEDGVSPIINAANYTATNGQTIWVRVEDTITGCYAIGSFQIIINTPLLLSTPTPLNLCDDDTTPNNQYHSFDLTVKNAEITQNLNGYTVSYYPSLSNAQNNTNVITTPTSYTNIFAAVQTLGVVVTNTATGCKSITTLDIRVLPIPTPNINPPALAAKCDTNNPGDGQELFDLTINADYIINGDPSLTLHYYASQGDAAVPQNEILLPTAALVGQNVWIRVENTRVDYQGNKCYVLVEQPLTVNPLPMVTQPLAPFKVCDNNTDGIAVFDLTNPTLTATILGTTQLPANYTVTYYATAQGANPLTNTGETPLPASYQNTTPNTQDIYIRVVSNATGCVNATGVLPLAVQEYAQATQPETYEICDNYTNPFDGVGQVDLTQFNTAILNGQNPAIFLISYYHTQADAIAGTNALAQNHITTPDTDTIWVKVANSSNSITPFCYALTTINITIERNPNPVITTPNNINTVCVNADDTMASTLTLNSGITNVAGYTFEWFVDGSTTPIPNATGSTYTVNTPSPTDDIREYTVKVTSTSPQGCTTTSAAFQVVQAGQAAIPTGTLGYTVSNAFTSSQTITVNIIGNGDYEYSLDDGPRQVSNVFENVSLGSHTIYVWDVESGDYSCGVLEIQNVQIIDYPHYFTPNGDGIHDTWNIFGLKSQPNAKIYIFDRYGKLLKQISSTGNGWDGTFNGHLLPATDYWFTVDYLEQNIEKQFKAHFSLKR